MGVVLSLLLIAHPKFAPFEVEALTCSKVLTSFHHLRLERKLAFDNQRNIIGLDTYIRKW